MHPTATTRPPMQQRLSYRVSRLARIMQTRVEEVLAPDGLTRMTWLVLTGLGEDGVRTPSELADYIGITRPAASRLLRRMEGLGNIRRNGAADGDGRSVALALTDRGREVLGRCRPRVDAVMERFAAKVEPETWQALIDGLGRLAEAEDIDFSSL